MPRLHALSAKFSESIAEANATVFFIVLHCKRLGLARASGGRRRVSIKGSVSAVSASPACANPTHSLKWFLFLPLFFPQWNHWSVHMKRSHNKSKHREGTERDANWKGMLKWKRIDFPVHFMWATVTLVCFMPCVENSAESLLKVMKRSPRRVFGCCQPAEETVLKVFLLY